MYGSEMTIIFTGTGNGKCSNNRMHQCNKVVPHMSGSTGCNYF